MNSNRRLLIFILSSVGLYLLLSITAVDLHLKYSPLKKINLVSDIIKQPDVKKIKKDTTTFTPPAITEKTQGKNFNLYKLPKFITNFNADTTQPSMSNFLQKLNDLKTGKKRKVRIGYFGDSMIEGDLLTQTLRKLLQKEFGGYGVGFVPITSQVSKFRQTVTDNYSDGWQDENFKTGSKFDLFFSGHLFRSKGDWVEMADQTIADTSPVIEKNLLCGFAGEPVSIKVNNKLLSIGAKNVFNKILISNDQRRKIKISVEDERLPIYGISFESQDGIIVDNFSFRGISGIELNKLNNAFLQSVNKINSYDLFIFQYGVNVLFRPNDLNFDWYAQTFLPVIKKIKNSFTNAEVLLISTADRAFRYDGKYKSATGIDSLIKTQAAMAYEVGCNFYNQYQTMGGYNSIVKWASQTPSLAKKDYVHPNYRGAEILANYLFEAVMNDYGKYLKTLK